jgi:hypothetical protein
MNFFFSTCTKNISSKLTIPKFQNSGNKNDGLQLYQAEIEGNCWNVYSPKGCVETDYFYYLENVDNYSIFFFGNDDGIKEIKEQNALRNIENFTDTSPDFRSNLLIKNKAGGFSSYQSEYPFRMVKAHGSLYSDCGLLTAPFGSTVGVFVRNIHCLPINEVKDIFLYSNATKSVLKKYQVKLNQTTFIDLSEWKEELSHCYLYADDFLGIPIYMVEYSDGSLSFEHTHPPHESLLGGDRFERVGALKRKAHEEIFKTAI